MFFPESIKLWILNSGITRNALDMIRKFRSKLDDANFRMKFEQLYLPLIESIGNQFFSDEPLTWEMLKKLSDQQLNFFEELIPENILSEWKSQNNKNMTCLKILGAGGGGFFLVFTLADSLPLKNFKLSRINFLKSKNAFPEHGKQSPIKPVN
jgi:galactokinase/mevalonate kinase-like predicted kinase